MAIGVQRQTEMNPITIVFAGINDHLHSRGFLSRLRERTTAEDAVWPAIKDILGSMGEVVDTLKESAFPKITPRAVFALSPGYAHLPDGLMFVYAMVALLSERKHDVIISAPNRGIEMENLRPLRAELPAVWSDISNAMPGFKDYSLHMLVLKNAEEKSAEFMTRVCQVTLEIFWTQNIKGEEGFDRTNSMLEGLGAGWTAFFLAKICPSLSRYLIKEFLQATVEVSIVELLPLFVTFGAENFVRGPVILLAEGN